MTRTTMKPRASLTVRIVLAVMAALLVMAALWAIVNLAAVNSYNQATQSLQENISTSRKDDADWDKLHTRQQQTDAQFNEASAMKPLLLPQVRESIEHNSHVSSQLTITRPRRSKPSRATSPLPRIQTPPTLRNRVNQVTRTTKTYPTNNVGK